MYRSTQFGLGQGCTAVNLPSFNLLVVMLLMFAVIIMDVCKFHKPFRWICNWIGLHFMEAL